MKSITTQDYQTIADLTFEYFGQAPFPIWVKPVRCGRANRSYITLPAWIQRKEIGYQIWYVVHEVSHIVHKRKRATFEDKLGAECRNVCRLRHSHCIHFKMIEQEALEQWK